MTVELIIGGARSGKSAHALKLTEAASKQCVFIATAEALDDEMAERIARHQADRGANWKTVEAPLALCDAIESNAAAANVCLVDCLTLWLSNLMHADRNIEAETDLLVKVLEQAKGRVILVSNEIGMGLVPEHPLGRRFRDKQGRLNQRIASVSDRVEFVAAGLPLTLKG